MPQNGENFINFYIFSTFFMLKKHQKFIFLQKFDEKNEVKKADFALFPIENGQN